MKSFGENLGTLVARFMEENGKSYALMAVAVFGDDGKGGESRKADVQKLVEGKVRKPNAATIRKYRNALDLSEEQIDQCRPEADRRLTSALLHKGEETGENDKLRQAGITENAILDLAKQIASNTEDLGQAWLELQNAMDIAVRVQQEGRVRSNHGDFLDEVLARVAKRSADGDYAGALSEIEEALAKQEAETVRLLESGVEVALLDGDTTRAAALLVRKADLDAGGIASFADLRVLQNFYYERGRDKGVNLDLDLAIDLAELVMARAKDADERGNAGNDLGNALRILGERESGTDRLETAVAAFEAALEERTRERAPLDWAGTQMNLGNALQRLGERESGTDRLEAAVAAYEAALEERTRERVPLDWARNQMNLGNALKTLGERESGTDRLEAAVAAYEAALKERTRERVPVQWAMTQFNIAGTELAFFEKTGKTDRLDAADRHVKAAREVFAEAGARQYVGIADAQLARIAALREAAD